MKNKLIIAVMAITALGAGMNANAQGLADSAHDFSDDVGLNLDAWNTSGEMCLPCHVPHNSLASTLGPLWNHAASTVAAAAFTMYSGSSSFQATGLIPGPESMACLSCHDGTVALDAFGGAAGTPAKMMGALSGPVVGGSSSLENEHPIGFTYDAALVTLDGARLHPLEEWVGDQPLVLVFGSFT